MRYVTAQQCVVIQLGRQGENNVETVQFDVKDLIEEYGEGSFALLHKRSHDTAPYPCEITVDGNTVNWVVTSADVYYKGHGQAQFMYIVNDAVAKTIIYTTNVLPSIDGGEEPEPTPSWVTTALEVREDAEAYAVGTRNGEAVLPEDIAYHNNAKYYSGLTDRRVFWCEYGVTTAEEIYTALENGELPVVVYTVGTVDVVTPFDEDDQRNNTYRFAKIYNDIYIVITVRKNNSSWSFQNRQQYVNHTSTILSDSSRFAYGGGYGKSADIDMIIKIDDEPTEGHDNNYIVSSGGIYNALNNVVKIATTEEYLEALYS